MVALLGFENVAILSDDGEYEKVSRMIIEHQDENYKITGLYPLSYQTITLYEYGDKMYIQFKFGNSKERFVSYNNCIHLTRFVSDNGLFGGSTEPIVKTLSLKQVL